MYKPITFYRNIFDEKMPQKAQTITFGRDRLCKGGQVLTIQLEGRVVFSQIWSWLWEPEIFIIRQECIMADRITCRNIILLLHKQYIISMVHPDFAKSFVYRKHSQRAFFYISIYHSQTKLWVPVWQMQV